jgi:hypothetical protein
MPTSSDDDASRGDASWRSTVPITRRGDPDRAAAGAALVGVRRGDGAAARNAYAYAHAFTCASDGHVHRRRRPQRIDPAVDDEVGREGVPPDRPAGPAHDRARARGRGLGLQRLDPGPADRGRRRRPGPDLRHQPAARADQRTLARRAAAQRDGWRRRADPARDPSGQDVQMRVHVRSRGRSCITRTSTR